MKHANSESDTEFSLFYYVPVTDIMLKIFFSFLPGRSNHPVFKAITGIDESRVLFKKTVMEELSWRSAIFIKFLLTHEERAEILS